MNGTVIYRGGEHVILCFGGEWHTLRTTDGVTRRSGRCREWGGGCPARARLERQRAERIRQEIEQAYGGYHLDSGGTCYSDTDPGL